MTLRLDQIYQDVILDHYKHPQHRGLREPFGAQVSHVNPICGDEVTLRVALSDAVPSARLRHRCSPSR
jgi:nitrogen fixation NifU-like protein